METTKYTPEKWTLDETWMLIMGPKGEQIAAIHSGQPDGAKVDRNIAHANGEMIAAAPETKRQRDALLEAFKSACDVLDSVMGTLAAEHPELLPKFNSDIRKAMSARAVIADCERGEA